MIPPSIVAEQVKRRKDIYDQSKAAVHDKLTPLGYRIFVEEYHPESFGHRWVDWTNGKNSIRFMWEARDSWFYLYTLKGVPQSWMDDWKVIIYIPYDPGQHDLSYANQIPGKIVASLPKQE